MWPAAESAAQHKGCPHLASRELRLCTRQPLREQTVPGSPCREGREGRSGFHDHRQLHGHFSKGCFRRLHPPCGRSPGSGSASPRLHPKSESHRCRWTVRCTHTSCHDRVGNLSERGLSILFDTGGFGISGGLGALRASGSFSVFSWFVFSVLGFSVSKLN